MDTIVAVSSGAPPAAIAVLRISGPAALRAATQLAGPLPDDRRATLRAIRDPRDGALLDRALLLVFRGPATATGEDLVELHLHGGRAVVAAVERAALAIPTLRRAEPGEFTRRALINGRIDLTEAEGLGDLLRAETESQRRIAITAAEGGVRQRIGQWSARLLGLSARVEAELDFSDEDDVAVAEIDTLHTAIAALHRDIDAILSQPPVERLHHGVRVVLAGPPNSGKSSLINALADRDVAIVSPIAGTTRDRIEVAVQRNGIAYLLTDTAGLAPASTDPIELIGIGRARETIAAADMLLWLGDDPPPGDALWLHSRADAPGRTRPRDGTALSVSAVTGAGLPQLWTSIERQAAALLPRLDDIALNARQRQFASAASEALERACSADDVLVVAEELRDARAALDRITGQIGTEDMLDALFGTFCIGK